MEVELINVFSLYHVLIVLLSSKGGVTLQLLMAVC